MSTPLGLTERHRKKQLSISARVLKLLLPLRITLAEAFRSDNPNISVNDWLELAAPVILSGREESFRAGYDYYQAVRKAATGDSSAPLFDDLYTAPEAEKIRISLLVTGPGTYRRKLAEGANEDQAARAAQSAVMGAATRHVIDGSRNLITSAVKADQKARGWIRVTDGNPCAFCAMLATRGFAVMKDEDGLYTSKESALTVVQGKGSRQLGEKYHDNCGCTAMPVFGSTFAIPGEAEKWNKLYQESTADFSGEDKLKAFRRAYNNSRKADNG